MSTSDICSLEQSKLVAQNLFLSYGRNSTSITERDCAKILNDKYSYFNRMHKPVQGEYSTLFDVFDVNKDGWVTYHDCEMLCMKYLCPKEYSKQYGDTVYRKQIKQELEKPSFVSVKGEHDDIDFNQASPQKDYILDTHKRQSYGPTVDAQLEIAYQLFRTFDKNGSGFLGREELAQVIQETYKIIGIDLIPTERDVQQWLKMADKNLDGKISLREYDKIILDSLKAQGFLVEPVGSLDTVNEYRPASIY